MRVVLGLLLVLLGLCGSGAQGEGGGLSEVGERDISAEVRALRDMVVGMESRLTDSESQVDELKAELMVTKVRMELLQRENSDLQVRLSSSESELLISKSRIDELKRNTETPKVAFHTALTYDGYVGPYNTDTILKYYKVFNNIGNAYYPPTGFFTAPVSGVYYFQFTMYGNISQASGVIVYANNQRLMYNVQRKQYDGRVEYFTNSVIFKLDAGQKFYLVLPAGHTVYDDENHHSTFSGALLFTL